MCVVCIHLYICTHIFIKGEGSKTVCGVGLGVFLCVLYVYIYLYVHIYLYMQRAPRMSVAWAQVCSYVYCRYIYIYIYVNIYL